ncbi:hypothetical protein [Streptomyces sp. NPDC056670]|uniref:hypothetical protein n=1 Tax=unclassified Streptomyces TaxID=2593676 RepID=UPI0036B63EC4
MANEYDGEVFGVTSKQGRPDGATGPFTFDPAVADRYRAGDVVEHGSVRYRVGRTPPSGTPGTDAAVGYTPTAVDI